MKKESIGRFIISSIITLMNLALVSAQPYYFGDLKSSAEYGINSIIDVLSPIFEALIGDYSSSEFFFSKVLVLILISIIITKLIEKTPLGEKNRKVNLIIAILISVISIRFINENNFFESIFIQYGTLGISITTIIPMVVFFYMIHNVKIGTFGRKVFWAIYSITLIALWISKSPQMPKVANWIYGLTITATIIFISFDKTIHSYFGLTDLKKFQKKENKESILRAKERIQKLNDRLNNGLLSHYEWREGVHKEETLIRELSKET